MFHDDDDATGEGGGESPLRGIRESHRFRQRCSELGLNAFRIDEIMEGVMEFLHRAAHTRPMIPGTTWRLLVLGGVYGPEFFLYYSLSEDRQVDIEWIEMEEGDPDEPVE